jgi:hypothetical protein
LAKAIEEMVFGMKVGDVSDALTLKEWICDFCESQETLRNLALPNCAAVCP